MQVSIEKMEFLKISIITPCFNMEKYIEGTIQSVLNQNYPNLEYIIIDGNSTDRTLEIVRKYEDRITKIISEPDNGMYDAINKGLKMATGDIMAYINADDQYLPGALRLVNKIFSNFPGVDWISGVPTFMDEERILTEVLPTCGAKKQKDILNGFFRRQVYGCIMQESTFWRKTLWDKAGSSLDTTLRYAGDFELWTRFAQYSPLTMVDLPLSSFMRRNESLSKAGIKCYDEEVMKVCQNKKKYPNFLWKLARSSEFLSILLRMLTISKTSIITYNLKQRKLKLTTKCQGVSYHTLSSILRRKGLSLFY